MGVIVAVVVVDMFPIVEELLQLKFYMEGIEEDVTTFTLSFRDMPRDARAR